MSIKSSQNNSKIELNKNQYYISYYLIKRVFFKAPNIQDTHNEALDKYFEISFISCRNYDFCT